MAKRQRNLRKRQLAADDDEKDDDSESTGRDIALPLRYMPHHLCIRHTSKPAVLAPYCIPLPTIGPLPLSELNE